MLDLIHHPIIWGERGRESGPKPSKEEQHSELRDKKKKKQTPAEGSERGDFSHLHKVLHFIYIFVLIIYVL